jgi:ACT domain-containing protein
MPKRSKRSSKVSSITSADVRYLVGPVTDDTVSAILKCGASVEDLEVAMSYVLGEGSAVDRLGHPMKGKVARLYDILSSDELYADAEER